MQDVAGSANLSWKPDLEIQLASYEVQWLQRKKAWNEDEQDIPAALPEEHVRKLPQRDVNDITV
eukprot:4040533-Amphidinium_carterae.1